MAIYHLSAKIIPRAGGRSAVAAAAYRAAAAYEDRRLGQTFDYTRKQGVEHTEILTPENVPLWAHDREALWNQVERVEVRKDAQLAREIELGLPVELSKQDQVDLLRDFANRAFVSKGMIVDLTVHRDNPANPHAHFMLTTRQVTGEGFGPKRRDWNDKARLLAWREQWAEVTNEHLLHAGLDIRIDHRSLKAQGIELVPGRKLGLSKERQQSPHLPRNLAERVAEQREIAAENGRRILKDPNLALQALTHMHATFTRRDVGKYLHSRTDGAEQFDAAFLKVTTSPQLVALGNDEEGRARFTTREMLDLEHKMLERAQRLASGSRHSLRVAHQEQVLNDGRLSSQQREAFEHVTGESDLAVLVGVAGAGKSTMLEYARRAWEAGGYSVKGAALAGIAAENLETASGIPARTLASWERSWSQGRELLGKRDVLVIDEAGLVGTRQLARVLESAEKAGAKVVLVGDPEQLQAIEAGAPFRGIAARVGMAEMNEVRRQKIPWQREATRQMASGHTTKALAAYEQAQAIHSAPTREAAREGLLNAWREAAIQHPSESLLMLAYTRDDVRQLNAQARELRQAAGELGRSETVETERGARQFAPGDRIYFLRNERSLGVKNGSLGTLEKIESGVLQIRMDGKESRRVAVDSNHYSHLEHGYATTTHKAQSTTVDRTFVLATSHFDRHATYVALSRHRESVTAFYAAEDFGGGADASALSPEQLRSGFQSVLSRARPKELAHDYLDREVSLSSSMSASNAKIMADIDTVQQNAAERWRAKRRARELHGELDISSEPSLTTQRRSQRSLEDDLDI